MSSTPDSSWTSNSRIGQAHHLYLDIPVSVRASLVCTAVHPPLLSERCSLTSSSPPLNPYCEVKTKDAYSQQVGPTGWIALREKTVDQIREEVKETSKKLIDSKAHK